MRVYKDGHTKIDPKIESLADEFLTAHGVDPDKYSGADIGGRMNPLENVSDYVNEFRYRLLQKGRKPKHFMSTDYTAKQRNIIYILSAIKLDYNDMRKQNGIFSK